MRVLCFFIMLMFLHNGLFAQYIPTNERGDRLLRAQSILDGENIRVTINNSFVSGSILGLPNEYRFEWPKNSGHSYIYFIQNWIGAEVLDDNGDTLNIVSVPQYRTDPTGDISWTIEPVAGYHNPDYPGIASSDDPASWPNMIQGGWRDKQDDADDPGWIGSWNSMWGKNNFLATQEFYYHASDDKYHYTYQYTPDSTDLSRGGLGLIISHRVFVFDFLPDEVFFVSDIYNSGTKDIEKAASTLWIADLIGSNSHDDFAEIDTTREIIYFVDYDGLEIPNWSTGIPALFFLETPFHNTINNKTETGMTGAVRYPAGDISNWRDDRRLFRRYMTPGIFDLNNSAGEFDIWLTNGYFNLPNGESQRLAYVVSFGKEKSDIENKYDMIHSVYDAISSGTQTLPLSFNNPGPDEQISGTYSITWETKENDPQVLISILHSADNGKSWQLIADVVENTGSFSWNTTDVADGILNRLKILAWDGKEFNIVDNESVFTINNPGEALPQIDLISAGDDEILSGTQIIKWVGGDADGDPVTYDLSYKLNGKEVNLVTGLANAQEYQWNTNIYPNAPSYTLYAKITDGQSIDIDSLESIAVFNERDSLVASETFDRSTTGTGKIKVNIFDESLLKGKSYQVKFRAQDMGLVYDVIEASKNDTIIKGATEIFGSEGPAFDGMRLYIESDPTKLLPELSGWNDPEIYGYNFDVVRFLDLVGIPDAADYLMTFEDSIVDTSTGYNINAGGTTYPLDPVPLKFTIKNLTTGYPIDFAFYEFDGDGQFSIDPDNTNNADVIYFLKKVENDSFYPSWSLFLSHKEVGRNPQKGDTLKLILSKEFQPGDSFNFTTSATGIREPKTKLTSFSLSPNYPNPFNMQTRFRFSLPEKAQVNAAIYDILGRKVKDLLDKKMQAGAYAFEWDGKSNSQTGVASGIYFIHFKANSFNKMQKLLLIK